MNGRSPKPTMRRFGSSEWEIYTISIGEFVFSLDAFQEDAYFRQETSPSRVPGVEAAAGQGRAI